MPAIARASRQTRYLARCFGSACPARRPLDLASVEAKGKNSNGPALILLHGLFGSKNNFRSLVKTFAERLSVDVYAVDLRNHGQSPHDAEHTYSAMAEDIIHFAKTNGLNKVALLGHSMGGKVALATALKEPDLAQLVISADMSPAKGPVGGSFRTYIEAMREIEGANVKKRSEAESILSQFEESQAIRQFLLTNLVHREDGSFAFRNPLDVIETALDEIGLFPFEPESPPRYSGPILFIKGEKSKYLNKYTIKTSEEFFPQMQLRTLNTGHWVHSEDPQGFIKLVCDFWRESQKT